MHEHNGVLFSNLEDGNVIANSLAACSDAWNPLNIMLHLV